MHIGDWLARRERLTPDKVALLDRSRGGEARAITYKEWNRAANRTARFLRDRLGVRRGDLVAILAHNCREYLELWFAVGKLGAVLQVLNWRLTVPELAGILTRAMPRVLLYGQAFADQIGPVLARLPAVGGLGVLGGLGDRGVLGAGPLCVALDGEGEDLRLAERSGSSDEALAEIAVREEDPWVICYTGGTTGLPKGAVLTHGSIAANAVGTIVSWGLVAEDVAILDAPLFHTGGLNVFTSPLAYLGGTTIVCSRFDPEQTFDLMRDAGVTVYFGVPTMFLLLMQHPRFADADLSRVRIMICGGAPCPPSVIEAFARKGVPFRVGYGLTEAGPNNFWLPAARVRDRAGSVGVPMLHVDATIRGADGRECGVDEVGELLLRGPHLCRGYLDDDEAFQAVMRPLPAHSPSVHEQEREGQGAPRREGQGAPRREGQSAPRWLHTGDLARRDGEGLYSIVGRLKDLFISGGENVYPAEIEGAIHAHPAVAEAAVFPVADDRWGEVGRAVVTLRAGAALTEEELLAFLRQRLAGYKVPRSIVLVEALPKTGANKIDKQTLIARYR